MVCSRMGGLLPGFRFEKKFKNEDGRNQAEQRKKLGWKGFAHSCYFNFETEQKVSTNKS